MRRPFAVKFACEVKDFDPFAYMDRKEAKRADLFTQYAVATAVQAMRDAKLADTDCVRSRIASA